MMDFPVLCYYQVVLSAGHAVLLRGGLYIQEEIHHCCYLHYGLGSSELDDKNAVGVLDMLGMSQLNGKGGDS